MRTFSDLQSQFRRTRKTQFAQLSDTPDSIKLQVERIHSRKELQTFPMIQTNYRMHREIVKKDIDNMSLRKNKSLTFAGEVIGSKLTSKTDDKPQPLFNFDRQPMMRLTRNQLLSRGNFGFNPTRIDPRFKEIYSQLKDKAKVSHLTIGTAPFASMRDKYAPVRTNPIKVARIRKSAVKYLKEDNDSEATDIQDQVNRIMNGCTTQDEVFHAAYILQEQNYIEEEDEIIDL